MGRKRSRNQHVRRAARRLFAVALTGLLAVAVGLVAWPVALKQYYIARIHSPDPTTRARALETVLPYAKTDGSVRDRLLTALTDLAHADDDVGPIQARVAAGWLFRHVPAFAELAEARLTEARDDDAFGRLVRLMIVGGRWDVPERPVAQRCRWLIYRFESSEGQQRADAIDAMAELGPPAAGPLGPALRQAMADSSATVRRAAIRAAAIVLRGDAADVLVTCTNDADPGNRRLAILMMAAVGTRDDAAQAAIGRRLSDPDADVRHAAAWALSDRPSGRRVSEAITERLAEMLADDPSPAVRAMAALAIRDNGLLMQRITRDDEVVVRTRCLWSLRAPLAQDQWPHVAKIVGKDTKYWVVMAAVAAAGRCASQHPPDCIRQALLARLEQTLASGEDALACACLRSLGQLGDPAVAGLLRDIVTRFASRSWVALAAAQAATRIQCVTGAELLLQLLDCPNDAARGLAALDLSLLPTEARPDEALRAATRSPNESIRAGAVLALALINRRCGCGDADLLGFLKQRTDRSSRFYETRLPLRGYYLCGQFLMGDAAVRDQIVALMAAEVLVPSVACLTMLAGGDPMGLDGPLLGRTTMPTDFDVRSFLCDDRFGEVVAHDLPDAPRVDWRHDPDRQAWQIDRLRDWWLVHRHDWP